MDICLPSSEVLTESGGVISHSQKWGIFSLIKITLSGSIHRKKYLNQKTLTKCLHKIAQIIENIEFYKRTVLIKNRVKTIELFLSQMTRDVGFINLNADNLILMKNKRNSKHQKQVEDYSDVENFDEEPSGLETFKDKASVEASKEEGVEKIVK